MTDGHLTRVTKSKGLALVSTAVGGKTVDRNGQKRRERNLTTKDECQHETSEDTSDQTKRTSQPILLYKIQ